MANKWTAAQHRKFKATMKARKKNGKANGENVVSGEMPLHLIERMQPAKTTPEQRMRRVFAEYDVKRDAMFLVLGSTRLPFRVRG